MPTLFRLLLVVGTFVAVAYGAMYAVVAAVKPQPRQIVEAIALPRQADDLKTGRSAAEKLDSQAALLVHPEHRKRRVAH